MNNNKIGGLLQLVLTKEPYITQESIKDLTGVDINKRNWELLVQVGPGFESVTQKIPFTFERLNEQFIIIRIDQDYIMQLSEEESVFYIELPKVMQYTALPELNAICSPASVSSEQGYSVTGRGVLIAVIDSGINVFHEDFITQNQKTRIVSLWDQMAPGVPPAGFLSGTLYTEKQINEALQAPTREEAKRMVPSEDVISHGTGLAGIAGGNGRASGGRNKGVAPDSSFIIVKVGQEEGDPVAYRGARNTDVMKGISFAVREAIRLNKPLSLLVGLGYNDGAHNGKDSLEIFINQISSTWIMNMTVGTGNEANKESHTSGRWIQGETKEVQIIIGTDETYYYAMFYKNFVDVVSFVIEAPNGQVSEILNGETQNNAFVLGNAAVLVNFARQPLVATNEEITLLFEPFGDDKLDVGIWKIRFFPENIVDGTYNIWSVAQDPNNRTSRFTNPDPFSTLVIPSTATLITSVAALNSKTLQPLSGSGRGFTADQGIKPDIGAPGLAITAPSNLEVTGYTTLSGTSSAAAFVCGAYALFLQYGLDNSPAYYYYGEDLKGYVLKYAKRLIQFEPFPNAFSGYGILCVENVLRALQLAYLT